LGPATTVNEKDDRSRPFAGMTRIRFKGSPPGLPVEGSGLSALCLGLPSE
jgi:hypothetical protein